MILTLFYSHNNIKTLLETANKEMDNLKEWFKANKLSLNVSKTKYAFSRKLTNRDTIPRKLPDLCINGFIIERAKVMKILGILTDENLTWRKHIEMIESKVSKNRGVLYNAKCLLDQQRLKSIYYPYIHSYLSYANIIWSSPNYTKLTKLHNKQKHAVRIIFHENKLATARPLMKQLKALDNFQTNLFQTLLFVFKVKHQLTTIRIPTSISKNRSQLFY